MADRHLIRYQQLIQEQLSSLMLRELDVEPGILVTVSKVIVSADLQVAELIRTDRIDILVDLAGHTANNRMMVLGMKPAPIQVTYLGYFATTGLPTIDYWITDQVLHPDDTEEKTSETIWRLPRCYVGYEPLKNA